LGRTPGDLLVDRVAMRDHGRDEFASKRRGIRVTFFLGEVALEDRVRGALPEIRFEDGRQGQPATGPPAADTVSPRRHRPAR
jgi:hypothetical protein